MHSGESIMDTRLEIAVMFMTRHSHYTPKQALEYADRIIMEHEDTKTKNVSVELFVELLTIKELEESNIGLEEELEVKTLECINLTNRIRELEQQVKQIKER